MSYSALASVYDRLTTNVGYKRRAAYIHRQLKQNKVDGIVLDAGCGTGTLTLLLASMGYDMIGVDASADMLDIAMRKAADRHPDITWLQQDLSHLDLYGTVQAIVCMQDTLNHFGGDLSRAIKRLSMFLEPGGLFIFDINTRYKHRDVLSDNSFIYELDDDLCVWQNSYERLRRRVRMTVDVFIKNLNGSYRRETDEFFEYDIHPDKLEKLLARYGYAGLERIDGESYEPLTDDSQRILYVIRKA